MTIDPNKLIDLNLLKRYDTNLKNWIIEKKQIIFVPRSDFPQVGNSNVLYVDDDNKIYRWDESTQDYIIVNSASSGDTTSLEWEEITTERK